MSHYHSMYKLQSLIKQIHLCLFVTEELRHLVVQKIWSYCITQPIGLSPYNSFSSPYISIRRIQFYMKMWSILGSLVKAIKYDFLWLWCFSNHYSQRNCFIHVTWSSELEVLTNLLFYETNSSVAKNVIRNMPLCTSVGLVTNSSSNPTLLQNILLAIKIGANSFMSQACLSPLPQCATGPCLTRYLSKMIWLWPSCLPFTSPKIHLAHTIHKNSCDRKNKKQQTNAENIKD